MRVGKAEQSRMNKKGLHLEIPGWGKLRLQQALFDLNATLALDGILPEAVGERLLRLQETLALSVWLLRIPMVRQLI